MPTTVNIQKNIKKYHTLVGHMFLLIIIMVTHSKKCACVRVICLFALRDSVRDVMSANLKEAFNDILLVVNAEVVLRYQQHILQRPLILPRSANSSIMRSYKVLGCQIFSDRRLLQSWTKVNVYRGKKEQSCAFSDGIY